MRIARRKNAILVYIAIICLALSIPIFYYNGNRMPKFEAYFPDTSGITNQIFIPRTDDVFINSSSSLWDLGIHKHFIRFNNLKIKRDFFTRESNRILGINPYYDLNKSFTLIVGSKTVLGTKFIQQHGSEIENLIEISSVDDLYFTDEASNLFIFTKIEKIIVFFDPYLYHFSTTNGAQYIENTYNNIVERIIKFQIEKEAQLTFITSPPIFQNVIDLDYVSNAHVIFVPNVLDLSVSTDLNNLLLQGMKSCNLVGKFILEEDSYIESASASQVSEIIFKIFSNFTRGRTEIKAKEKEKTSSILNRLYPECNVSVVRNAHKFTKHNVGTINTITLEMDNNLKTIIQNNYLENYRINNSSEPYMSFVIVWPMYKNDQNKTVINNFFTQISNEYDRCPNANFEIVFAAPSDIIQNLQVPKKLIEITQLISITNKTLSKMPGHKDRQYTMSFLNIALNHVSGKFVCIIDMSVFVPRRILDMTVQESLNEYIVYRSQIIELNGNVNKANLELIDMPWLSVNEKFSPDRDWSYIYSPQNTKYTFGGMLIIVSTKVLKNVTPFDELNFPHVEKFILNTLHKFVGKVLITEPIPFMYNSYVNHIAFTPPNENQTLCYYEFGSNISSF